MANKAPSRESIAAEEHLKLVNEILASHRLKKSNPVSEFFQVVLGLSINVAILLVLAIVLFAAIWELTGINLFPQFAMDIWASLNAPPPAGSILAELESEGVPMDFASLWTYCFVAILVCFGLIATAKGHFEPSKKRRRFEEDAV